MKRMSNWLSKNQFNKNDELYTPSILVKPIIKYLIPDSVIWCPFDTKSSEFVIQFTNSGFKVIYSHIKNGQDFFEYEPIEHYDYIISNPPFSRKLEVLDRLYKLNKPFGMILGLPILNYQDVGDFFSDRNDLQLLIVNKKVSFNGSTASFNNSFFCRNLLPRDIIWGKLEHNNSKKYFKPSTTFLLKTRIEKIRKILKIY